MEKSRSFPKGKTFNSMTKRTRRSAFSPGADGALPGASSPSADRGADGAARDAAEPDAAERGAIPGADGASSTGASADGAEPDALPCAERGADSADLGAERAYTFGAGGAGGALLFVPSFLI